MIREKYDKAVLLLNELKKQGYFTHDLEDQLDLANWYFDVQKNPKPAENIIDHVVRQINNPTSLMMAPQKESDFVDFLLDLQDKETGSWVKYPTHDHIEIERASFITTHLRENTKKPKYYLRFLEKYSSKQKLKDYFYQLLHDYDHNNRKELNVCFTVLIRVYKNTKDYFPWEAGWLETYFELIQEWQDPETGFWGPWIKKDGRIEKLSDLSITFHLLRRYLNSDGTRRTGSPRLNYPEKIISTVFSLKEKEYPYGWLEEGSWSTHHNFDVALILVTLFDYMTESQKQETRELFQQFLDWTFGECYLDGGFIGMLPKNKIPYIKDTYFGVQLLNHIGYFDSDIRKRVFGTESMNDLNSQRTYNNFIPEDEFDTTNLENINYSFKTKIPDPLETRLKVFKFLQKDKEFDLEYAPYIDNVLKFKEFPPTSVDITYSDLILEKNKTVIAVNKFGGICK